MKKSILSLTVLLLIAALLITFTACGSGGTSGDDGKAVQTDAATEAPTEEQTEGFNAEAAAAEAQKQLVGNWTFYNFMYKEAYESLVFNADGTGSYQGGTKENDKYEKDYTFSYTVSSELDKYGGTVNVLTIKYNEIDETEVRHFGFYDDGKLFLTYVDYDHYLITFDEYTRVEDVPKE